MAKKAKNTEQQLSQLESELSFIAQQIYEMGERRIQPLWPWLLIRLVPKEQSRNGLVLPENFGASTQNKPLFEGIVLETWKPHWRRIKELGENKDHYRMSDLMIGDRVLFPSFAGVPVHFLDVNNYRLVREWTFDANGGVQGIVNYQKDELTRFALNDIFKNHESVTLSGR